MVHKMSQREEGPSRLSLQVTTANFLIEPSLPACSASGAWNPKKHSTSSLGPSRLVVTQALLRYTRTNKTITTLEMKNYGV